MKHHFFITGDTHGRIERFSFKNFPVGKSLNKNDIMFIAGDFGLIWKNKEDDEEKYWLNWLDKRPWTTLIILGNHENYNAIKNNYQEIEINIDGTPFKVYKVRDSVFIVKRAQYFKIGEKTFFCFGGARSIDKESRIVNISWWEDELPNFKECNDALEILTVNNNKVDYIITHEIPFDVIKILYPNDYIKDYMNSFLSEIYNKVKYSQWYGGHHHRNIINIGNTNVNILYNDIIEIK